MILKLLELLYIYGWNIYKKNAVKTLNIWYIVIEHNCTVLVILRTFNHVTFTSSNYRIYVFKYFQYL